MQAVDVYNRGDLKPEISNSIEFGLEWRLFNSRVDFDFTYYKTDTKNQLLKVPTSAGEDYAYRYIKQVDSATRDLKSHWELLRC